MTSDSNGNGRVTIKQVYELLGPLDSRVRRLEVMVGVLTVATVSPKLGGPAAADALAVVVGLFG